MKEILRKALAECDVDYCEIRLEETDGTSIAFRGPGLESCDRAVSFGGNVRALYRGAWGFVTFNRADDLPSKVRLACRQARVIGDIQKGPSRLAPVPAVDETIPLTVVQDPRNVPLSDKVELLSRYNRLITGFNPSIASSMAIYFDRHSRIFFANTQYTYIEQEKSDLGCNLTAVAKEGGLTTNRYVGVGGSEGFQVMLGLEPKIEKACRTALDLLQAPPVQGGVYPVILDPDLAGVFIHEAFGHLSEADAVADDENMRRLMTLGTRFGPDGLNVFDSGLEAGNRGSARYDDEGTPVQKTQLIRDGILVGRLHTRETAGKMGERPTGNARAVDYRFPPICRMRTTFIDQGTAPLEEMMAGIQSGIYAAGAYGGQTNGEMFTFTASEGYLIRDGRLDGLVRDVTLTGNLVTTLNSIDRIGNDFMIFNTAGGCGKGAQAPLPTSTGSPHIRIQNVIVGGVK